MSKAEKHFPPPRFRCGGSAACSNNIANVDGDQTDGSMEGDCSSDESSTAASDGDSRAITSVINTTPPQKVVARYAGDGFYPNNTKTLDEDHIVEDQRVDPVTVAAKASAWMRLCADEVLHVLSFLAPPDVLASTATSRALRAVLLLADGILWAPHCERLWRGKQRYGTAMATLRNKAPPATAPYAMTSTNAGAQQRPQQQQRGRKTAAFSSAFEQLCLTALQHCHLPPPGQARHTSPTAAGGGRLNLETLTPLASNLRWWDLPSDAQLQVMLTASSNNTTSDNAPAPAAAAISWRFAYFMSMRDSKQRALANGDLVASSWTITFKQAGTAGGGPTAAVAPPAKHPQSPAGSFANLPLTFRADGTLSTPLHGALPYQLGQGGTVLHVDPLPPLTVRRSGTANASKTTTTAASGTDREAWAWVMENFFVRMESVDGPMPAYLRKLPPPPPLPLPPSGPYITCAYTATTCAAGIKSLPLPPLSEPKTLEGFVIRLTSNDEHDSDQEGAGAAGDGGQVTEAHICQLHRDLIVPAFKAAEVEDLGVWLARLKAQKKTQRPCQQQQQQLAGDIEEAAESDESDFFFAIALLTRATDGACLGAAVHEIYIDSKTALISYIVVSPELRGKGAAGVLNHAVLANAQRVVAQRCHGAALDGLFIDVLQRRDNECSPSAAQRAKATFPSAARQAIFQRLGYTALDVDLVYPGHMRGDRYNIGVWVAANPTAAAAAIARGEDGNSNSLPPHLQHFPTRVVVAFLTSLCRRIAADEALDPGEMAEVDAYCSALAPRPWIGMGNEFWK